VCADVIATSKDFDLCLLALPENSLMGVPVCFAATQPTLGEKTRAYGYPFPKIQGYTIKVTDRTVSGLFGLMDDHWISRRQPVS
jgi:hypothetical protein